VGDVRCVATPVGTTGYDDLLAHAEAIEIDGMSVRFASLDDCIRMKYAADRLQDRVLVCILESLRDELRRQS
jgi:predicted nucleotidyltransferase